MNLYHVTGIVCFQFPHEHPRYEACSLQIVAATPGKARVLWCQLHKHDDTRHCGYAEADEYIETRAKLLDKNINMPAEEVKA